MKRNTHIDQLLRATAIAFLVMGTVSCVEDEEVASVQRPAEKSDAVTFGINLSDKWEPDVIGDAPADESSSRSYSRTEALPMDCEDGMPGTEIYMYMVEEEQPIVSDTVAVASRSANSRTAGVPESIGILATHTVEDATSHFMDNILYSTYGKEGGAEQKFWPGNGSLNFYAYAPWTAIQTDAVKGLTLAWENNQPTFAYTVPTTIADQYDLMDGVTKDVPGNNLQRVNIDLKHNLSQVQVKTGTLDAGLIKAIRFKNIFNTGKRVMGSDTWQVTGESMADYVQTFTEGIKPESGIVIGSPMFLMPQTLSKAENAKPAMIEIDMEVTSPDPTKDDESTRKHQYTLNKNLSEFGTEWKSNKKYSYVISTPMEVEVEVTDVVEYNSANQPVKKDLHIRNIGLSTVRIRASIVGSWVLPNETEDDYSDDPVVAQWEPEKEGTFVWGKLNGGSEPTSTALTGWRKHADGYYYYLNPVERGDETAPLFESYTLTAQPPVAGAVLDLSIIVQAVFIDDVNNVWPSEITALFNGASSTGE